MTKTNRCFHFFGTLFFITATAYFAMLLWKAYLWALWLKQLEDRLIKQTPPTDSPLIVPNEKFPLL
tara:strand:+ start:4559 stop:4756 length:198 start_codon:yes stop_codon:yes gene_type:complete